MLMPRRFIPLLLALAISGSALAADPERTATPDVGGPGGSRFDFTCPNGSYLTGFQARHGEWIDSTTAECSYFNSKTNRLESGAKSPRFGGNGGGESSMRCQGPRGVVVGLTLHQATNRDKSLGHFLIDCADVFEPGKFANKAAGSVQYFGKATPIRLAVRCPPNYVADGIRGQSGKYLDRLGLNCIRKPAR